METIAKKLREYHKSRKYSYCSTVSGGDKAKVYLLDATLARLNKDRKIIKKIEMFIISKQIETTV